STFSVRTKCGRSMVNDPMVSVSWYGAVAYCNWRSGQLGKQPCYDSSTLQPIYPLRNGVRLPTEAEWEYAARGGLNGRRFPWGNDIYHAQANYWSSSSYSYDKGPTRDYHPLWNDGVWPCTSPVGFFDGSLKYKSAYNWPGSATSYQTTNGGNGYGLYDMAGNVWEWCNDWYSSYSSASQTNPTGPSSGSCRVLRGGNWYHIANYCRVAHRDSHWPDNRYSHLGFRVALDF
ncbi:MAG TPA: formylglycine-generating enzyme family protein, partial [Phycisphaerales bacterium]|nr:formylglycine-generating enzyme family protein [Phycisphaerales bacterium]